jgi:hypothetical protein
VILHPHLQITLAANTTGRATRIGAEIPLPSSSILVSNTLRMAKQLPSLYKQGYTKEAVAKSVLITNSYRQWYGTMRPDEVDCDNE